MTHKLLWYCCMLLAIGTSLTHAEYLVFKNVNDQATPFDPVTDEQTYKKIYTILQNYQWPMVIAKASSLDKADGTTLSKPNSAAAEEKFIRKKIKELSSDYEIAFIPTTFYEIFLITHLTNYVDDKEVKFFTTTELNYLSSIKEIETDKKIVELIKNFKNTDQTVQNYYREINFREDLIKAHFMVNNALLRFLSLPKGDAQKTININMQKLVNHVIGVKTKKWHLSYVYNTDTIRKLIELEYEARNKNMGLIYRGGKNKGLYMIGTKEIEKPIEGSFLATAERTPVAVTYQDLVLKYKAQTTPWKTRDWHEPLNSVSYGSSIFGGYWYESNRKPFSVIPGQIEATACACEYLDMPDLIGYALFIDKYEYMVAQFKSLFFIPSLNTLAAFFSQGEFFHPRSRAYALPSYLHAKKNEVTVPGIAYPQQESETDPTLTYFIDLAGIIAPPGDPLSKAIEFSRFVEKNARILKVANTEGGFNPPFKVVAQYTIAQRDLTDMLQATFTINKYLGIKREKQVNFDALKHEKTIEALIAGIKNDETAFAPQIKKFINEDMQENGFDLAMIVITKKISHMYKFIIPVIENIKSQPIKGLKESADFPARFNNKLYQVIFIIIFERIQPLYAAVASRIKGLDLTQIKDLLNDILRNVDSNQITADGEVKNIVKECFARITDQQMLKDLTFYIISLEREPLYDLVPDLLKRINDDEFEQRYQVRLFKEKLSLRKLLK